MKKLFLACFLFLSSSAIAEEKVCITQSEYNLALVKIQNIAELWAESRNFIKQLETLSAVRSSIAEGKAILEVVESIDSISNSLIKLTNTSLEAIDDPDYRERVISNFRRIQSSRLEFPTVSSDEFEGELDQIIIDLEGRS